MSNSSIVLSRPPSTSELLPRVLLARKNGRSPWPHGLSASLAVPAAEPSWLASYRAVTGFADASRLPPTLPQVRAVPLHMAMLVHPSFPLPPMGIVHVRQRIDVLAPLDPAMALELTATLSAPRGAKRGCEFDLITSARADNVEVWRGVTSILSRTRHAEATPLPAERDDSDDHEAVAPGTPLRAASWRLGEDLGRRYTAVAGDFNPIHLYAWSAKLFGFKRAIIHGMWTLARSLAELEDEVPAAGWSCEIGFRRPIFLPSQVVFSSERAAETIRFDVRARDGYREHVRGWLKAT